MNNNFKILDDYKFKINHNEICNNIEQIEKNIEKEDYKDIYIKARKILEGLMINIFPVNEKDTLHNQIIDVCNKNIVPTKVKNSFFDIKNITNFNLHRTKNTDKHFVIEPDLSSSIELLKKLFISIKYCLSQNLKNETNIEDYEKYKFNSNIYMKNKNSKKQEDKDVAIDKSGMESNMKGLFQLITTNYKFFIPTYQREYSWKKENIEVFLQDIEDRHKDTKKHYMGSLAISIDDKNKTIRLIDGQQRITTTLILIKAIIDIYKKRELNLPNELVDISKKIKNIYKNKMLTGDLNSVSKILSNVTIKNDLIFKKSIAKENYDIMFNYINNKEIQEIQEFLTTFIHKFIIAELTFENNLKNEIQIFENLNSKGLELSQWDLIKNYIYKKIEINVLIENETEIEKLINDLFFIPANKIFRNSKYNQLNDFFTFYSRIKYKIKNNKELKDKGKIYKIFAKIWEENKQEIDSLEYLKDSLIEIACYFEIFCILKDERYLDSDNKLFNERVYLKNIFKKSSAIVPLLMEILYSNCVWDEHKIKDIKKMDKINKYIKSIEKYITRLIIVSNKGQSLSLFFDSLIKENIDDSYNLFVKQIKSTSTLTSLPSYNLFINVLKNKTDWQVEYAFNVLRILEFSKTNINSGRYNVLTKPTLEHIFPQKTPPSSSWRKINNKLDDEKFSNKKSLNINKLGNYIILNNKLNIKASNNDFFNKKEEYRKDSNNVFIKGFKDNSLMNLFNKETFNFQDIDERTKQLANLIAPLYKFDWE